MPRLPSERDLGQIRGFESGRAVVSADLSAPARAMEGFGKSLDRTSDTLTAMAKTERAETESQRDTLEVTQANSHWRAKTAELDSKYSLANDGDYGTWKQRHDAELKKVAEEASGMISSENKRAVFAARLNGEVPQYNLSIAQRAQKIDIDTKRTGFEQTIDSNLGLATAGDPARGDAIMAETKAAIDSAVRTGIYTPAQGMQRWDLLKNKRAGITVERDIDADPDGAAVKLGAGPAASRASEAMRILQGKGWTPVQAAGWVGRLFQESNLNPNARNAGDGRDGSDSVGINQWNGSRAKELKAFAAARGKDWNDFGTQVEFIDHEARNSMSERTAFFAMQNAKTPEEAAKAAMHFARPAGYTSATPERGHGFDNTLRHTQRLAGGIGQGYADLTLDQRRAYGQRAESLAARRDNEESATLKNLISDDLNSIRATGQPVPELNMDRLAARLGREAAAQHMRERDAEMSYFGAVKDFDTMTPQQIGESVGGLEPVGGAIGFTEKQNVHQRAQKLAAQTIKQRGDDPAAAVDRHPMVSEALAAKNADPKSPDTWRALSKARMIAQRAIGIPESSLSPISNAEGVALFAPVISAPEGQEVPALRETAKLFDQLFGDDAPKAFVAALSASNLDKQSREAAAGILRKIGLGKAPTRDDAAKFQAAQAEDAEMRAAANVASDSRLGETDVYGNSPLSAADQMIVNQSAGERPQLPPEIKQTKIIPPKAVEFLQANPSAAEDFMKRYGGPEYGKDYAKNVLEKLGLGGKEVKKEIKRDGR